MLYALAVSGIKKKLLECKGEEIHIPVLKLLQTKRASGTPEALLMIFIRSISYIVHSK